MKKNCFKFSCSFDDSCKSFRYKRGKRGYVGFQGSQGPQGFQGPQGPQGFQGPQGLQGPTGSSVSVYGNVISFSSQPTPPDVVHPFSSNLVTFDTFGPANGILANSSGLTLQNPGIYQINADFQFSNLGHTQALITGQILVNDILYLEKNVSVPPASKGFPGIASINFQSILSILNVAVPATITLKWYSSNSSKVYLFAKNSPGRSPSALLFVIKISN